MFWTNWDWVNNSTRGATLYNLYIFILYSALRLDLLLYSTIHWLFILMLKLIFTSTGCVCVCVWNNFAQIEIYICTCVIHIVYGNIVISNEIGRWVTSHSFLNTTFMTFSIWIYSYSISLYRKYTRHKTVFRILASDYLVVISINFIAQVSNTTITISRSNGSTQTQRSIAKAFTSISVVEFWISLNPYNEMLLFSSNSKWKDKHTEHTHKANEPIPNSNRVCVCVLERAKDCKRKKVRQK